MTYSIKEKHPEIFLRMPFYYAYIALPLFVRLISVTTATVTTATVTATVATTTITTTAVATTRSRFFFRASYRYSKFSAIYFCFVQCCNRLITGFFICHLYETITFGTACLSVRNNSC